MASLGLVLDNLQRVSHSQLLPILHAEDDTAGGAATDWGVRGVTCGAALAAMDEEATTAAHLGRLLRVQVEGARFGDGRIMHGVLAVPELILGSGQWPSVDHALLGWVHVAFILPRVGMCVYGPLT